MRVFNKMTKIGGLIWLTGCIRMYKDGDAFDGIFRPWHPVTWLMFVVMVLPCALMGEKLGHVIPTKLSTFWSQNLEQLQWVTPFTRIDTLKPFVSPKKLARGTC